MIDNLVFKRNSEGFFKISNSALEFLLQHMQDQPHKPEAGGVLLGRHLLDTKDIVVDHVTTPMTEDRQARHSFRRARLSHQEIIDKLWKESNETCTYLGEWHTHPEPIPLPSVVDKCDWRRKLMFDHFSESIFFVIVGTATVRVWEGHFRRFSLFLLQDAK